MLIKNALILKENFKFERGNIEFDTRINNFVSNFALESMDATGLMLIPGLIDMHTHGAAGFDCTRASDEYYADMCKYYVANGVTSFVLTTMSTPLPDLRAILENMAGLIRQTHDYAYPHGVYLEGSFINQDKCGSHLSQYLLEADITLLEELMDAARGYIKIISVAPEINNALPLIEYAAKHAVVSLAHTNAKYDLACKAVELGATNATHVFNAMAPISAREPGVIGAIIDNDKVFTEVIADGAHLHKSIVRMVFKLCGDNRVILVSDSIAPTGLDVDSYSVYGQDIHVSGKSAKLADGRLAGSVSNLMDCVRNCVEYGIPLELAIKAASINPARLLGVDKFTGSISIGKYADMVMVDRDLNVKMVFIKGKLVFSCI